MGIPQPVPPVMGGHFPSISQDVDLRNSDIRNNVDPRLSRNMDLDMRSMPVNPSGSMDSAYMRPPAQSQPPSQRPIAISAPFQSDPRQRGDPRVKQQQLNRNNPLPSEMGKSNLGGGKIGPLVLVETLNKY